MRQSAKGPIMIGGCGSSGTTLLGHLLNSHPSIYCGPELYLLDKKRLYREPFQYSAADFRRMLGRGVPTEGIFGASLLPASVAGKPVRNSIFMPTLAGYGFTAEEACELAARCETFKDFVDAFSESTLRRAGPGKTRWAEKTPQNRFCIEEFLSLFPLGKYVHMVRDGRDVVLSLMKRGVSAAAAVRSWMHDTAIGLPWRGNSRYCELKYEDLVRAPKETMAKLLNFLDESADAEGILACAMNRQIEGHVHTTWNLRPDQQISTQAVGKWKSQKLGQKRYLELLFGHTVFSDALVERMGLKGKHCGNDILSMFGYDPSDGWDPAPKVNCRILAYAAIEQVWRWFGRSSPYFEVRFVSPAPPNGNGGSKENREA